MKKQEFFILISAAVLAAEAEAAPALPGAELDGAVVPAAAGRMLAISSHFRSSAANPETFEYEIHPFSHLAFASRQSFEESLDELGTRGFGSVMHLTNDLGDPADDERLFMRSRGGDFVRVVDHGIEAYRVDPDDPAEVWVEEWDRLGGEGKIPVFFFRQGGQWYVVTESTSIDGELLTWSWEKRQAGSDASPSAAEYRSAAKKLARERYMPITVGLSADLSKIYVVGIAETTPGVENDVRLKFQSSRLSDPAATFIGRVNRMGRRGFRLAAVEMLGSPENQEMVFAQIKENGHKTKRKRCVLVAVNVRNPASMLAPLNKRGAGGRRVDIVALVEDFFSAYLVLCDASQSTHRF